jgi:thiamine kinase-like enzyme
LQVALSGLRENSTVAVEHLISRGVVTAADILSQPIRIFGLPSRNVVLLLELSSQSLLYKEFRPTFPLGSHRGAHEHDFLQLLATCAENGKLVDFTPRLIDYDAASGRLLTEAIETDPSPHETLLAGTPMAAAAFRSIGAKLAKLHALQRAEFPDSPVGDAEPPFLLGLNEVDFGIAQMTSPIHGDLRLANVIIQRRDMDPRLIDWENSGWGDPMWDLGQFMGSITYLLSPRYPEIGETIENAARRFVELLKAYGAALDKGDIEKLALFASVAFLQFAFEEAQVGFSYRDPDVLIENALSFRKLFAEAFSQHA